MRPLTNLKDLNPFMPYQNFKMLDRHIIKDTKIEIE